MNLSCAASRLPLTAGLDCQWQVALGDIPMRRILLLTFTESAGSESILPSLANAGCDSGAGAATLCPAPARDTTVSNFPIVPQCRPSRCSAREAVSAPHLPEILNVFVSEGGRLSPMRSTKVISVPLSVVFIGKVGVSGTWVDSCLDRRVCEVELGEIGGDGYSLTLAVVGCHARFSG